jgi:hypothetical protein
MVANRCRQRGISHPIQYFGRFAGMIFISFADIVHEAAAIEQAFVQKNAFFAQRSRDIARRLCNLPAMRDDRQRYIQLLINITARLIAGVVARFFTFQSLHIISPVSKSMVQSKLSIPHMP